MIVYEVVSKYYDNGKTEAYMRTIEVETKPENKQRRTPWNDVYIEYFTSKKKAEDVVKFCRKA